MNQTTVQSSAQYTCQQYPLQQKKIAKKTLASAIGWFFGIFLWAALLIYTAVPESLFKAYVNPWIVWGLAQMFIWSATLIYQILYFRSYFYDLQAPHMIVRKGVVGRTEVTTQYNRIQNVYVDQDFWDRIFGLYDLQVITAGLEIGTTQPMNHIDGLNQSDAYTLRDILLEKTQGMVQQQQPPQASIAGAASVVQQGLQ